jgi:methylglutaconyl-CoA hydratase
MVHVQQEEQVITLTLNRPEIHNALSPEMVVDLTSLFLSIASRDDVRVVVLTGAGRSFCAGADLAAMRAAADYDFQENVDDALALYDLMAAVDGCPKPVVARVNGAAIGGGVGLVSCCDIAVASGRAKFALSETRLGLIPAVISPYVLAKIGSSQARGLFLTGAPFDSATAYRIGLIHEVVDESDLDRQVEHWVSELLVASPSAQAAAKALIAQVSRQEVNDLRQYTANEIALRRDSAEGREGMSAFLEKRSPRWQV